MFKDSELGKLLVKPQKLPTGLGFVSYHQREPYKEFKSWFIEQLELNNRFNATLSICRAKKAGTELGFFSGFRHSDPYCLGHCTRLKHSGAPRTPDIQQSELALPKYLWARASEISQNCTLNTDLKQEHSLLGSALSQAACSKMALDSTSPSHTE